jgi:hypothetical protein
MGRLVASFTVYWSPDASSFIHMSVYCTCLCDYLVEVARKTLDQCNVNVLIISALGDTK